MRLAVFKKKAGDKFDKYGELLHLYRPFGFIEKSKVQVSNLKLEKSKYQARCMPDVSLIFSSSAEGVLLYEAGQVTRIGPKTGAYGIVKYEGYWYCFFKSGRTGGIYKFKIEKGKAIDFNCIYYGLSRGVHQLEVFEGKLYVTDTYNNRIIVLPDFAIATSRFWKSDNHSEFYPCGKLGRAGRNSLNYKHVNSIFFEGGVVWLIAHNETTKTGVPSELLKCNVEDFTVIESTSLNGSNCHNIYISKERDLFCASMEGKVVSFRNDSVIDSCSGLTRGLSVAKDLIVYGVSPIERNRSQRGLGALCLKVLDSKSGGNVGELDVYAGQVHEIRRVDTLDFAMGLS